MDQHRVVAVLGTGVVPAETPILRADDLGALRGDGIFETMHLRGGQPWLLDRHLARLARSAQRLDIPLPPASALQDLIAQACAAWGSPAEASVRIVCTRGPESGGPPTVYATVGGVAEPTRAARRDGVDAVTATLAFGVHDRSAAPWLLGGAKTTSYAVNMASLRWAAAQGVHEVLWVSGDGYLLEAPTSTIVWLDGDTLCTVPAAQTGILPSTTAAWLLEHAGELGWRAEERLIRPASLADTDGAWLASSVRGLAEIRTLDGARVSESEETTRIQKLLGFAA